MPMKDSGATRRENGVACLLLLRLAFQQIDHRETMTPISRCSCADPGHG
jgi:hypothetical protein